MRTQADSRSSSISFRAGADAVQTGARQVQRCAKAHWPADLVGVGHGSGDRFEPREAAVARRLGQQQPERVGVQRLGVERRGRAALEDPAGVEDLDPVAHRERDPQIVGDQHQAHAARLLQIAQPGEDLALGGDVERGRRLVRDQQLGVARERRRDADPLAHAAGQLERVGVDDAGVADPDLGQSLDRQCAPLRAAQAAAALVADQFDDVLAAAHQRIEHGERVLEDHADLAAADGGQAGFGPAEQFLAAVTDAAGRGEPGRQQPHDRARGDRFAAAGLADDAHRLAGAHPQADRAADRAFAGTEMAHHPQVGDVEQRRAVSHRARPRSRRRSKA